MFFRATFSVLTMVCLLVVQCLPAAAQESYNLTSTAKSMTAGSTHSAVINVGGTPRAISPGDQLTPAEMVALNQVINSGRQTLLVGSQGNAIGGRLNVGMDAGTALASLHVPQAVTALAGFNTTSNYSFSGNLVNAGNLYAYTNNPAVTTATFNAVNILNSQGAVLSSVTPSSLLAITGAVHPLNLVLNATGAISNAGTISSSAGLSVATNTLTNSGTIAANAGNLNINSQTPGNIDVNNQGGTLSAVNGNINVRDASFTGKHDFNLNGGNVLSNNLNINSGCGTANVHVNDITSEVSINAGAAHVSAATPNLKLGTINLSGDPTFYNTAGDITLSAPIVAAGAPIAIVASRNIIFNTGAGVDASDNGGGGGDITIIAGADLVPDATANASVNGVPAGNTPPTGSDGVTLTVNGASGTGGKIQNNSTAGLVITSQDTGGGNSGQIQIAAFSGTSSDSGTIDLADNIGGVSATISSNAIGGGNNGDITIIAGARSGLGIDLEVSTVNAGVASGSGTGNVIIRTTQPSVSSGYSILDGAVSGTLEAGEMRSSSVRIGDINTAGGQVFVAAGRDVHIGGRVRSRSGPIGIFGGGNIDMATPNTSNQLDSRLAGAGGGNISLGAGINIASSGPNIDSIIFSGPSVTGGNIALGGSNALTLFSSSAAAGSLGDGGAVALFAGHGSTFGSGQIVVPVTIQTGGDTGGNSGDVRVIGAADAPFGTGITLSGIDTAGTGSPASGNVAINGAQLSPSPQVYVSGTLSNVPFPDGGGGGDVVVGVVSTPGSNVQFESRGDLTVAAITNDAATSFSPAVFLKASNGVLTFGGNVNSTAADPLATGGNITVTAKQIAVTSATLLRANGVVTGGNVFVTSTGAGNSVSVGVGANQLQLEALATTATGGTNGMVFVTSGGDLTVTDAAALNVAGTPGSTHNGGIIGLTAGTAGQGNLSIQAVLDVRGDAANFNSAGQIVLGVVSTTPFDIGNATTNGIEGVNAVGQSGGILTVNAQGSGGLNLSDPESIVVSDFGGSVTLFTPGNLTTANPMSSFLTVPSGTINLTAKSFGLSNVLRLDVSSITGQAAGTIGISGTGAGKGVANGGTITVGSSTGNFQLLASGTALPGGSSAGTITIDSASNIVIDNSSLANFDITPTGTANSAGAHLEFFAGVGKGQTGMVEIRQGLNLSGVGSGPTAGAGGDLIVVENTKTAFIFSNSATPNGVNGQVIVDGNPAGSVGVSNLGGAITVDNTLSFQTTSAFATSSGELNLFAGAGNLIVTPAGGVSGSIDVSGGDNGGSVSLQAPKGIVSVFGFVNAGGSDFGGEIEIITSSSKPFVIGGAVPGTAGIVIGLNATGGTVGFGTLSVTNLGTGGINVGTNGIGDLFLNGDNKGTVTLEAKGGGNVVVNQAILMNATSGLSTSGGNLTVSALKGNVVVLGAITVESATGGNGGSISITSNSGKPFVVDSATPPVNGIAGDISLVGNNGGTLSVTNLGTGGITTPSTSINASGTTDGGNIILNAAKGNLAITGTGALDVSAANVGGQIVLTSNSAKPFTINNPATVNGVGSLTSTGGTAGGLISVTNLGAGGIRASGNGTFINTGVTGNVGGQVKLSTKGAIVFDEGFRIDATGTSVGGVIRVVGGSFSVVGNTTQVTFDASVPGTGTGGSISMYSDKKLDTTAFLLDAHGGGAGNKGGIVTISSGSDLITSTSDFDVSAALGHGGILNLIAGAKGSGNLVITSPLTNNGVNGGKINLFSNSSKPFTVGSTAGGNGVNGAITANATALGGDDAGSIGIKNSGAGGILILDPANNIALVSDFAGGTLDLQAPKGTITFDTSVSNSIEVNSGPNVGAGDGGTITVTAKALATVGGGALTFNARGQGFVSAGGVLTVNQTGNGLLKLGNNPGEFNFDLTAAFPGRITFKSGASILVNSQIGQVNSIIVLTVSPTGTGTIRTDNTNGVIVGDVLVLNSGKGDIGQSQVKDPSQVLASIGANNLQTGVNTLIVHSEGGNVFVDNASGISIAGATQKTLAGKKQFFTVNGDGASSVTGSIVAPAQNVALIAASGDLNIGASVLAKNITLISDSSGPTQVTQSSGVIGASGATLNLNSGSLGINLNQVNATTINIDGAGGNVDITAMSTITSLNIQGINFNDVFVAAAGSINTSTAPMAAAGTLQLSTLAGTNGSIILNSSSIDAGTISLLCDGFGSVMQTGTGALSSTDLQLKSDFGNLGTNATPLRASATVTLSANTGGAGTVNINVLQSAVSVNASSSGGNFKLNSEFGITTQGNITAQHGSLTLTSSNTTNTTVNMSVGDYNTLFSGAGRLTIQNGDTATGTIAVGQGANLIANGDIFVVVGTLPLNPTNGTGPLNTTVVNAADTYFGANGISDQAPQNLIDATGGSSVIFDQSATGTDIALFGGVTIRTYAAPKVLTSLDLTNTTAVAALVGPGIDTSNLAISSSGIATGGTLVIDSSVNLASLSALNIPKGVTVELRGFDAGSPVGVQISGSTKNANIAGIVAFTSTTFTDFVSDGSFYVTSTVPGTILTVAKTGEISSDGHLSIKTGGDLSVLGAAFASGNLTFIGTAGTNFKADPAGSGPLSGSIRLNGSVLNATLANGIIDGVGILRVQSTAGIYQNGGILQSRHLELAALGNILQKGGTLTAETMQVVTGDVGAKFSTGKNAFSVGFISLFTAPFPTANVSFSNVRETSVNGIVGGTLSITAPAGITSNFLSANTISIITPKLNTITALNAVSPFSGTITVTSPSTATQLLIDGTATWTANHGVTINAPGAKTILTVQDITVNNNSGAIKITSTAGTIVAATLTSGFISPVYVSGIVNPLFAVQAGTIAISTKSGAINIGAIVPFVGPIGANLKSVGGNLSINAGVGGLGFVGNTSSLTALGGDLLLFSAGNLFGASQNNNFTANAVGTTATNATGGSIELGAGTKTNTIASALLLPVGTRPAPITLIARPGQVNDTSVSGVVVANIKGTGTINLTVVPGFDVAVLSLNGGALVLDANSKPLSFQGCVFTTNAFMPIGYQSTTNSPSSDGEYVVDTELEDEMDHDMLPVSMR